MESVSPQLWAAYARTLREHRGQGGWPDLAELRRLAEEEEACPWALSVLTAGLLPELAEDSTPPGRRRRRALTGELASIYDPEALLGRPTVLAPTPDCLIALLIAGQFVYAYVVDPWGRELTLPQLNQAARDWTEAIHRSGRSKGSTLAPHRYDAAHLLPQDFLRHLRERGLAGVRLVTSDKCLGLVESIGQVFPEARWQRCMVHWYRNVPTLVPRGKSRDVAAMLKAIHGQEDRPAALDKAEQVTRKLEGMRLGTAAALVHESADETLAYMHFPRAACPREGGGRIRTNPPLERIMREIRRRTRVVGNFPDGESALMLVAARLRHVAGTRLGTRRYLDMTKLDEVTEEEAA